MRQFFSLALLACSIAGSGQADTFVVLPFFNASKTPNLDWIGESISETLREALASQGLIVLDRDDRQEAYRRLSIRQYSLLTHATVLKIGDALDAGSLIYGEFQFTPGPAPQSKGSLRIAARLVDLRHMRQSQPFAEVGALDDLGMLQRRVAWQALKLAAPETKLSEKEFEQRFPTVRLDAIENYIRGLLAASPDQKHKLLTQAARLDARYSPPCFQLGKLNWEKKDYQTAAEWFAKVSPIDPHHREATFFLGLCRYYTSDYAGAVQSLELVARTVPLNEVLNNLGAAQSRRDLPEALDNFRKALEGDESDPVYHFNVGYALWKRGDYEAAAERFRAVLERDPADAVATSMLGRSVKRIGPRPGDTRAEGLERLKHEYREAVYLQLKEFVEPAKK